MARITSSPCWAKTPDLELTRPMRTGSLAWAKVPIGSAAQMAAIATARRVGDAMFIRIPSLGWMSDVVPGNGGGLHHHVLMEFFEACIMDASVGDDGALGHGAVAFGDAGHQRH